MREVKGQLLVVSIFASHLLHTSTGDENLENNTTLWLCLRNSSDKIQASTFRKLDIIFFIIILILWKYQPNGPCCTT
jgi:hypothetical protein